MSQPPNNTPGRSQALAGRNVTGSINAIAAQADVQQAYQAKATTSSSTLTITAMNLTGSVNGVNKVFGLPQKPVNGYLMFSDGALLSSDQYSISGLIVTMATAPTNTASVLFF